MRALSQAMLAALHAPESGEVALPLIEITAEGWDGVERFVANSWSAVVSGGQTYHPLPFRIGLPDEADEEAPGEVELSIDNVSREIGRALRLVTGDVGVVLRYVLASQPDVIDIGPIAFVAQSVRTGAGEVVMQLSAQVLLDQVFGQHVLNPVNAPGLHG